MSRRVAQTRPGEDRAGLGDTAASALRRVGRVLPVLALATALVVLAAAPAGAQPEASPERLLEQLRATPLPPRDPLGLAMRLRGVPADALAAARPSVAPRQVGEGAEFWIVDQRAARTFKARATVQLATERAYWYVQDDLLARAPRADVERSAAVFEARTYPTLRQYFGSEPQPGIDGDPRIAFLLGDVPGVAAYFSGADTSPRAASPRSNERDIIYVNLNALRPGTGAFDATIAHEFEHLLSFARCPVQETWVDEGAAELASRLAGYRGATLASFSARPDVQLNAWSNQPSELARHYEASYLFWSYVTGRAGGPSGLPGLLETCARGEELFQRFLERQAGGQGFDRLFADWTVANLLDDPALDDGRYAYPDAEVRVSVTATLARGGRVQGLVPQYAANYLELPPGGGPFRFTGAAAVPLVGTGDAAATVWWSNRSDSLDSTLTRRIDLGGLDRASARFQVWYDLEEQYDYVYLVASSDGGATWRTLPGRYTGSDEAMGNGYGVGWTGVSGGGAEPRWVEEEVDLSPFAGAEVLLRFEYLTDQGYSARGFALDDFWIPELGLADDASAEGVWEADGWLRVDAPLPQRWQLRLVRWTRQGVAVDAVPIDADGGATFRLDATDERAVLVVAPTAPRTLQPGSYLLEDLGSADGR